VRTAPEVVRFAGAQASRNPGVLLAASLAILEIPAPMSAAVERQLLYVASPGTRNYVENGGVGILVFDSDNGYKFVRRIPHLERAEGLSAEVILVHFTFSPVFFLFFVVAFCPVFVLVFFLFVVLTGNDISRRLEAGSELPVFLPGFSQLFT